MTTIATDGITIAADGLANSDGEITTRDRVKVRVAHGRVYALCGASAAFDPAIKWHVDGADPEKAPKAGEWWLVVIEHNGKGCWYTNDVPYPTQLVYPAALGSGERFALGAMHAGKSPREAVEIAAKLDTQTGGTITEINIAQALAGTIVPMKATGRSRR